MRCVCMHARTRAMSLLLLRARIQSDQMTECGGFASAIYSKDITMKTSSVVNTDT
jgi:hypothetical protein